MKVLIAEDNRLTRLMLESTLRRWGYEVIATANGAEALEALLSDESISLAVLDWMMPKGDGVTVCREVRARRIEPYVYLILLTARNNKEDIVAGLEAGADDYIAKPFHPEELRVRIRVGERIVDLHRKLLQAREELRLQALTDPLTRIWNHGAILDRVEEELRRAERRGTALTVAMVDVDHFKQVNDTYGHAVGDRVLIETAQRLKEVLRPYDSLGRYGGEEFLVAVPNADQQVVHSVGQRLCDAVRSSPYRVGELELKITTSVGLSIWRPGRPASTAQLIQEADLALYHVKRNGRNGYAVYQELPLDQPASPAAAAAGHDSLPPG